MEGVCRRAFLALMFALLLINAPLSLYYLYAGTRIVKYYPIELTTLLGFENTRELGLYLIVAGKLIGVSAIAEVIALVLAAVPRRFLRVLAVAVACFDLGWRMYVDTVLYGYVMASFSCMLHVVLETVAVVCGLVGVYVSFLGRR